MFTRTRFILGLWAATFISPLGLIAEEGTAAPAAPMLQAGDIDHIMKTLPKLKADLEQMGAKWEDVESPSQGQALQASEQMQAIFQRYGWDEDGEFAGKFAAMAAAFGQAKLEAELANLPAEQRKMMAQMMQGGMANLSGAHPQDVAKVKAKLPELEAFFESM